MPRLNTVNNGKLIDKSRNSISKNSAVKPNFLIPACKMLRKWHFKSASFSKQDVTKTTLGREDYQRCISVVYQIYYDAKMIKRQPLKFLVFWYFCSCTERETYNLNTRSNAAFKPKPNHQSTLQYKGILGCKVRFPTHACMPAGESGWKWRLIIHLHVQSSISDVMF